MACQMSSTARARSRLVSAASRSSRRLLILHVAPPRNALPLATSPTPPTHSSITRACALSFPFPSSSLSLQRSPNCFASLLQQATSNRRPQAGRESEEIRQEPGAPLRHPCKLASQCAHNAPSTSSVSLELDRRYKDDPQMCAEYAEDIYHHLLDAEEIHSPSPSYMERVQSDINQQMRGILVDWLVEVAEEYRLHSDTLFLSVLYTDKALSIFSVPRSQLQLVGVTAMLIASKLEEIYAPSVEEFCYITDNTYSREQVIEMEQKILHALQYQLVCPTTKTFLRRFLRASQGDQQVDFLASYIAELSLLEYRFLSYNPSTIAASTVFLANSALNRQPWSQTLVSYTRHTPDQLKEPVNALLASFRSSLESSLPAVGEKYSQSRFAKIATTPVPTTIPPENFM